MYNIYDMLKDGMSADELASAFTDELNAAIQKQKEDEAAAKAAQDFELKKKIKAEEIAFELAGFIEHCYPELVDPEATEPVVTGETLIQLLDSVDKLQKTINGFKLTLHNEVAPVEEKITDDISKVFNSFFDKYGL